MPPPSVAIIDIGSNSIKLLVAAQSPAGGLSSRKTRTLDARIGAGISETAPRLAPESMMRGLGAIRELLAEAAPYGPRRTVLVATSAVRDAANGAEFREKVRAATGHTIRVLSGEEEANLIGRGLTCDPALGSLRDFYVFDLGGGSLECLAFLGRRMQKAVSLQLGCVRLTEKFVPKPEEPFPADAAAAIAAHVRTTFAEGGFPFTLPAGTASAVGTGGTVTTVRAILAARAGRPLDATDPTVTVAQLQALLDELGALPLADRKRIPGLPPPRADVFPVALATLGAIAQLGTFTAFRHSLYNLRWGLAAEAFAS
jgi:exopolyphosphatase/guanosine-5'-triphosphate,3'-diphosphate pyrophosphatase